MKDWGELENFHLALMERHYGSFSIAANNVSAFPLWKQASCGGTLKPVGYWRVGEGRELEFLFAFSVVSPPRNRGVTPCRALAWILRKFRVLLAISLRLFMLR